MEIIWGNWRNIFEEVKYWDALDLIKNYEVELEKARNGLMHWIFCPVKNFPSLSGDIDSFILTPEITELGEGIRISFPNLKGISREDIQVEIDNNVLSVVVEINRKGRRINGWFKMRTPEYIDIDTCDAELEGDSLILCLNRKQIPQKVKKIIEIK